MKFIIISLAVFFALISCGTKTQQPVDANKEQTAPASDLMKETPAYDATAIDPKAAVVEIVLKAQGNTMADMRYDQTEIHVPAGSTVKLVFFNEGTDNTMLHNFVLIESGTADAVAKAGLTAGADKNYVPSSGQVLVSTPVLNPKAKTELTFPAPEKGTYDFICTYPGHYQKMNGKFIVD